MTYRHKASRESLLEGLPRQNLRLLDEALQAYLPACSTLTHFALAISFELLGLWSSTQTGLFAIQTVVQIVLFIYSFIGLALGCAQLKACAAILSGPVYILSRTWLDSIPRYGCSQVQ